LLLPQILSWSYRKKKSFHHLHLHLHHHHHHHLHLSYFYLLPVVLLVLIGLSMIWEGWMFNAPAAMHFIGWLNI
jgi:hypothetical protein